MVKVTTAGTLSNTALLDTLQKIRGQLNTCGYHGDSLESTLLRNIGWSYFDRRAYTTAAAYFKQSIAVINAHIHSRSVRAGDLVSGYYYLSTFYDSLNAGPEKRKYADSCIRVAFRLHLQNDLLFLYALFNRLQYFYDIGEYRLCMEDAVLCEKYAGDFLKITTGKENRAAGIAVQQSSFGWSVNALVRLSAFSEAEKILGGKIIEYEKEKMPDYLAFAYSKMADVKEAKGDYKSALVFYTKSYDGYRKNGNDFYCKQQLNTIAENIYFRHQADYSSALVFFRKALAFRNRDDMLAHQDAMEELNIYGRMANSFVEKGQFDSAFVYFDHAFGRIGNGLNEKNILDYKDLNEFSLLHKIDYLFGLLVDKGVAYKRRFEATGKKDYLANSIEACAVADQLLERIIKAQFAPDSRLYWRKDSRRLYENAIQACYMAQQPEKAFYFFEKSRAVLLAMQLSEQGRLGSADIAVLATLKKKLVYFQGERSNFTVHSKEYAQYSDSILLKSQELYYKEDSIKQGDLAFYQNNDTAVATIGQVQQALLQDHDALLEIFSGESAVYSLLLTAGHVSIEKIDKDAYRNLAVSYVSYIADRNLLNSHFAGFLETAGALYNLLFHVQSPPPGRIIISPDGEYFPFESLVTGSTANGPVYFLADHAVSYTYSAGYLLSKSRLPAATPAGNFFGMAPVQYASDTILAGLPGSDQSLESIGAHIAHATFLTGSRASKNNFTGQFSKYRIVQLYTHAAENSQREEPVIYFSDAPLYLSELVPGAQPATQLIVLSACETGNGVNYQGEGVFSFNRAFAALGVPSSVTSLWAIDNLSTYQLTELFYQFLLEGWPLDIALQKAKLAYMRVNGNEKQMPYYWAAPILVGKTAPVQLEKPFAWTYLVTGTCLLVLAFIAWKKIRKRQWVNPIPGTAQTAS